MTTDQHVNDDEILDEKFDLLDDDGLEHKVEPSNHENTKLEDLIKKIKPHIAKIFIIAAVFCIVVVTFSMIKVTKPKEQLSKFGSIQVVKETHTLPIVKTENQLINKDVKSTGINDNIIPIEPTSVLPPTNNINNKNIIPNSQSLPSSPWQTGQIPPTVTQTASDNKNLSNGDFFSIEKTIKPVVEQTNHVSVEQLRELQATISSLTNEINAYTNLVKQISEAMGSVKNNVQNFTQGMSDLDKRVLLLSETVDGLARDLAKTKKVIQEEDLDIAYIPEQETQKITNDAAKISYIVHAIIPGRAWLKSSNGQIITVAEGENINGYGTVVIIDPANNLVRMSSGVVFK